MNQSEVDIYTDVYGFGNILQADSLETSAKSCADNVWCARFKFLDRLQHYLTHILPLVRVDGTDCTWCTLRLILGGALPKYSASMQCSPSHPRSRSLAHSHLKYVLTHTLTITCSFACCCDET